MIKFPRTGALLLIASGLWGCTVSTGNPDETSPAPPAETATAEPTLPPETATQPPTASMVPDTPTRAPTPVPTPEATRPQPTPRDRQAPLIEHDPQTEPILEGEALVISATVTDNLAVFRVNLFYRAAGQADFVSTTMSEDRIDTIYLGTIPGSAAQKPGLEYYISARDPSGNTALSPEAAPESSYFVDVLGEGETPAPTDPPHDTPTPIQPTNPPVDTPTPIQPTDPPVHTPTLPPPTLPVGVTPTASPTPALETPTDEPATLPPVDTPTEPEPTLPSTPTAPDPTDTPITSDGPVFNSYPGAIIVGQRVDLAASGGSPPYTFAVETNASSGRINADTGLWRSGGTGGTDVIKVSDSEGRVGRATVNVLTCSGDTATLQRDNGVVTYFDSFVSGDRIAVGMEVTDASLTPNNVKAWFYQLPTGSDAVRATATVYDDDGGQPGVAIAQGAETAISVNWPDAAQNFALGPASRALVEGEMLWIVLDFHDSSPETGGFVLDNGTFNSSAMLLRNQGSGWDRDSNYSPLIRVSGCHVPLLDEGPTGAELRLATNDPNLDGRPLGVIRFNPRPAGGQLADRFIVTTGTYELSEVRAYFIVNSDAEPEGLFKVRVHEDAGGQPGQVIGESEEELASGEYPSYYTFTLNLPVYFLPGEAFWISVTSIEDQLTDLYGLVSDNGIREDDPVFTRQSALTRDSSADPWEPLTFLGNDESLLVQAVGLSSQGNATGDLYTLDFTTLSNDCGFGAATGELMWAYDAIDGRIHTYNGYAFKPFMWVDGAGTNSLSYTSPTYHFDSDDGVTIYHYEGEASLNRDNFGGTYRLIVDPATTNPAYTPCTIEMAVIGSK